MASAILHVALIMNFAEDARVACLLALCGQDCCKRYVVYRTIDSCDSATQRKMSKSNLELIWLS